jgi:hypothetical protein
MFFVSLSKVIHNPSLILIPSFISIFIITMANKKIKREIAIIVSLISTFLSASTIPDLFSKYVLDLTHILDHIMLIAIFLLNAHLLTTKHALAKAVTNIFHPIHERVEINIFDKLNYTLAKAVTNIFHPIHERVEINIFDKLNYTLAKAVTNISKGFRKIHTGNLNINMLAFLMFILLSFILFFFYF